MTEAAGALLKTIIFMLIFGGLAMAMAGVYLLFDGVLIGFIIAPIGVFMLVYGFIRAVEI